MAAPIRSEPPDALTLARRIADGDLDPADAIAEARARIERDDPHVNAVVRLYDDIAPAQSGPFTGVPTLLKDLLAGEAGRPLTSGAKLLAGFVAPQSTAMVERLRAAGLVVIGRTNTPEFGMMVTTEPALFGPCRNPWSPAHTAGGSSGGAAAAVAAGMVPLAHATDGGGSIRIPASCCGCFGFKPSRGINPLEPACTDMLGVLTAEHVITRSVRDSAVLLAATGDVPDAPDGVAAQLASLHRPPPPLRIRVVDRIWNPAAPHPDVAASLRGAADLCESLGHRVEVGPLPGREIEVAAAFADFYCDQAHQTLDALGRLFGRRIRPDDVEPLTWAMAERGSVFNTRARLATLDRLLDAQAAVTAAFADFDVLLTPTLATPPIAIGRLNGQRSDIEAVFAERLAFAPNTALFNITGQPAMSLPLGLSADGLPIGAQCVAATGQDWLLMRLARSLEPQFVQAGGCGPGPAEAGRGGPGYCAPCT